MRQYFGMDNESKNKSSNNPNYSWRYCYGVGSGGTTVGGDTHTTLTKPMSQAMIEMCTELSNSKLFHIHGQYVKKRKVNFNHITILYYFMDGKGNNKCILNSHCDIQVSPKNIVLENNSQMKDTPTIVLSLCASKTVSFSKRYSNGTKFSDANVVDSMTMNDGEIFVLHPRDERVIKRKVLNNKSGISKWYTELLPSQFQHSVNQNMKTQPKDARHEQYKVSISICFRETNQCLRICKRSHNLLNEYGELVDNKYDTISSKERYKTILNKRKDITDSKNLIRIQKKLKNYHKSSVNY